ncbi:MAG: glycosyltransferase, partial [Verrucomicrobiota bacterium]
LVRAGCGAGAMQSVIGEADPLVQKLDFQPDLPALPVWLAATDAYLHTAAYEGLPLAIIEALSMGKPCFLTSEMIREVHAFHHQPCLVALDPEGLWIQKLTNTHKLTDPGIQARRLYEKHFRVETMAAGYEHIYEEAIQGT